NLHSLRPENQPAIITLLGSTLCNQRNPLHLLTTLQKTLQPEDLLIIGTEIVTDEQKRELNTSWIPENLYQIQFSALEYLGLSQKSGTFIARFNPERGQTEVVFELQEDVTLPVGEEILELLKGEELLLMRITDFSGNKLRTLLEKAGLTE